VGHLPPEQQQQQVRRAGSIEPAANGQAGWQQEQAGQVAQEQFGGRGGSLLDAAEPSQQLGLSPGAAAEAAAAAAAGPAWQGPSGAGASAGPTPLAAFTPAATPAPGVTAGSSRRLYSGHAEEWGQLLRHAKLLVREMEQSDRKNSNHAFRHDISVTTEEQADARYQQAVSGKWPPAMCQPIFLGACCGRGSPLHAAHC
jgi:hypothetical protein